MNEWNYDELCRNFSISLRVKFFSPSHNSCFTLVIPKEEDLIISLKKATSGQELPRCRSIWNRHALQYLV